MQLRIGHFQCMSRYEAFDANLATLLRGLELGAAERLDVMSFPETFLDSYSETREGIRKIAYPIDHPKIRKVLDATRNHPLMFMVGFFELKGADVYNTVIVCENGKIVGSYSKAFPCSQHETPGRRFDVFEKKGIKFGIIICADSSYVEPARILALKGAQIIFAPHWNYMPQGKLIDHFLEVRHCHIARAVENGVWFLRANNWVEGNDPALGEPGVGYGDSVLLDPNGDVVVRAGLHCEKLISAAIDTDSRFYAKGPRRSALSSRELGTALAEATAQYFRGNP
jgi:predicted amidohydrolase